MKTFEEIFENWVNGNRKDVIESIDRFSAGEQNRFKNWIREKNGEDGFDKKSLFDMLLHICFEINLPY